MLYRLCHRIPSCRRLQLLEFGYGTSRIFEALTCGQYALALSFAGIFGLRVAKCQHCSRISSSWLTSKRTNKRSFWCYKLKQMVNGSSTQINKSSNEIQTPIFKSLSKAFTLKGVKVLKIYSKDLRCSHRTKPKKKNFFLSSIHLKPMRLDFFLIMLQLAMVMPDLRRLQLEVWQRNSILATAEIKKKRRSKKPKKQKLAPISNTKLVLICSNILS